MTEERPLATRRGPVMAYNPRMARLAQCRTERLESSSRRFHETWEDQSFLARTLEPSDAKVLEFLRQRRRTTRRI